MHYGEKIKKIGLLLSSGSGSISRVVVWGCALT